MEKVQKGMILEGITKDLISIQDLLQTQLNNQAQQEEIPWKTNMESNG